MAFSLGRSLQRTDAFSFTCMRCVFKSRPLSRSYATVVQENPLATSSQGFQAVQASSDMQNNFAPHNTTSVNPQNALRSYKPKTPGLRHLRRPINDHLWKGRPLLRLTLPKKGQSRGGRNHTGHITVRHRGGGHKRRLRIVDFRRDRPGPHLVERIEYDPGRSGHIALIHDQSDPNIKSYILAPEGTRAGDVVQSYLAGIPDDLLASMGGTVDPGVLAARTAWRGNCLPMHMVPIGTMIHNVGSHPSRRGVFCRSAGTYAIVLSKGEEAMEALATQKEEVTADQQEAAKEAAKWVTVKLQSGETRRVSKDACATIGVVSNPHWQHRQLGKAGRARWLGIRPTVRGMAMNACDHPHGGGRGKSKGNVPSVSIWGKPAKGGYKTRPRAHVNEWIVIPRHRNQGKRRAKG